MNMLTWAVIIVSVLGLIYGFFLAFAHKKLKVEENELVEKVENVLPQAQCGACGYAGCHSYALAVVMDDNVASDLCVPGKQQVANLVAELTNKKALALVPKYAHICCSGSNEKVKTAFHYEGITDCLAANLILGGPKACRYGCLGLGTCIDICPFEAITMGNDGLPDINVQKCTGCGVCMNACPRGVIKMVEMNTPVIVNCLSVDKGAAKRKVCTASCIGCGLCAKACSHGAIKIENNLAQINSQICINLCKDPVCAAKCPTKAICVVDKDDAGDCACLQTGVQ